MGGWKGSSTAQADCACVRSSISFDLNLRRLVRGGSPSYCDSGLGRVGIRGSVCLVRVSHSADGLCMYALVRFV